jgi:OTT_1508-like deaminase
MHVLPYIGFSKLSCIMCSHYIRAFNEVMEHKISIKGSHGKAYPGWSWPIPPARDEELRQVFFKKVSDSNSATISWITQKLKGDAQTAAWGLADPNGNYIQLIMTFSERTRPVVMFRFSECVSYVTSSSRLVQNL